MVERHVRQMVRLIDDLLDVSRISRGRIELRKRAVDLASIARDAVEAGARCRRQRQLPSLDAQMPDPPLWVHADPARLAQVLGNLLHNAVKFTRARRQRRVSRVERDGADAVCACATTASASPPDSCSASSSCSPRSTTRWTRAGRAGHRPGAGEALVELHGGTVDGAQRRHRPRQRVRGAAADRWRRAADVAAPARRRQHGVRLARVLVVDDNRDAADSMARDAGARRP